MPYGVKSWDDVRNVGFRFKECISVPGVDITRVHPWKQAVVKSIRDALIYDSRIERVVLFGSSVNIRCQMSSDLDVVIKMKDFSNDAKLDVSEKLQEACGWTADILWFDHLSENDRVYQEAKRGVRIV